MPAVITGVSIGAITAAILAASENPINTLTNVWREGFAVLAPLPGLFNAISELAVPHRVQQYLSALGNEGMYRLRPEYLSVPFFAPFLTDSIYDTSPLRETLMEVLDLGKLNSNGRVVVTAINVETGKLARFGNALSIKEGGTFDNEQGLSIDHIVASGSLPPGFPMTEINGSFYWDGGVGSNTPLSEAINCLERCDGGSRDVPRELIVVELVPMEGAKPSTMEEVMSRFFNMIFASKLELDRKLFAKFYDLMGLLEHIDFLLNVIKDDARLTKTVNDALALVGGGLTLEQIHGHSGYKQLMDHRRIDAFTRIPFTAGRELTDASDFSRASIEARIEAGRQEAKRQDIGKYHFLGTP
jgi:predicted acylesterase/phospholipase RssA